MSSFMLGAFIISILAIIYTQLGYLLCLWLLSCFIYRNIKKGDVYPTITFILPVHNEGKSIRRKIENLKSLDYPAELVQIIVVSDASTDDTIAQCSVFEGIQVIELEERSGKSKAINMGLESANGEIIALTDVAAQLEKDSLRNAARLFADFRVGCVSSEDAVISEGGVGVGEGIYSKLDTATRRLESKLVSATGMSGSFYMVRKKLCPPFPLDVANDMFTALHCVSRGYWAAVETNCKVCLIAQPEATREFDRKVRTMVTGLRAILVIPKLLNPIRYGLYSWCLISHKLLRYLIPAFAALAFISSIYLSLNSLFFRWIVCSELVVVCISLLKIKVKTNTHVPRILNIPAFFCIAVVAAVVAWYRFVKGDKYVVWQPTERRVL